MMNEYLILDLKGRVYRVFDVDGDAALQSIGQAIPDIDVEGLLILREIPRQNKHIRHVVKRKVLEAMM